MMNLGYISFNRKNYKRFYGENPNTIFPKGVRIMENEIRMDEVIETVAEGTESVIDAAAEGEKDVANVYIFAALAVGAGLTIAAKAAWKYGVKPGIKKLKELKKKHDDKELEKYIEVTEAEDTEQKEDEEESSK